MAADIELGLDLEDLVGDHLRNEGVGRRQRVFEIALSDDLSAEMGGSYLSLAWLILLVVSPGMPSVSVAAKA